MSDLIFEWMPENKILMAIISIVLNVIISLSGVLPSAFLTAINISVWGFKLGLVLSIVGEALGAIVSFILYRKGLTKLSNKVQIKNKWLLRLQYTKGLESIILVLLLRILPFVPSGAVTLIASYSQMNVYAFAFASTLGKVPALFLEAYAVDRALDLSKEWQFVTFLLVFMVSLAFVYFKKRKEG